MSKFQISDDGSIFSIGGDGTIGRLGKIDSQGNIEGKSHKSNSSVGILWFFFVVAVIVAIVLGVNLSEVSNDVSYYQREYNSLNNKQSNMSSENTRLKDEIDNLNTQNRNLQNENNNLHSENSTLSSSVQHYSNQSCITYYTSLVTDLYIYNRCGDNFEKTACRYSNVSGNSFGIYLIINGYGLTENGFVRMSDLKKN